MSVHLDYDGYVFFKSHDDESAHLQESKKLKAAFEEMQSRVLKAMLPVEKSPGNEAGGGSWLRELAPVDVWCNPLAWVCIGRIGDIDGRKQRHIVSEFSLQLTEHQIKPVKQGWHRQMITWDWINHVVWFYIGQEWITPPRRDWSRLICLNQANWAFVPGYDCSCKMLQGSIHMFFNQLMAWISMFPWLIFFYGGSPKPWETILE